MVTDAGCCCAGLDGFGAYATLLVKCGAAPFQALAVGQAIPRQQLSDVALPTWYNVERPVPPAEWHTQGSSELRLTVLLLRPAADMRTALPPLAAGAAAAFDVTGSGGGTGRGGPADRKSSSMPPSS